MAKTFLILALATMSACTYSSKTPAKSLNGEEFLAYCGIGSDEQTTKAISQCEKLHGEKFDATGILYYPNGDRYAAELFPAGTQVPADEDDPLWNSMPDSVEEINLRLPEKGLGSDNPVVKFHQKPVHVTGIVSTDCITKHREASAEMDKVNSQTSEGDDAVLIKVTGFCHYFGAYINDVKIEEIVQ